MATPLDIGLIAKFDIIFPFLLVMVLVYAFLSRTEWFKEKQAFAFFMGIIKRKVTVCQA